MRRKISKKEWELFIEEHTNNNKSLKAICLKYNLNYSTLYYGLIRKGVTPDTSLTTEYDRRQNDVIDNFFEVIDNEQKAYILGFLIADGAVDNNRNRIMLKLKEEDFYMLEKIKNILSTGYSLYKDSSTIAGKTFYSYKLEIKSSQLVNDLIDLGVIPRKTGFEVLPKINEKYVSHMIRGVFDGDGSISAGVGKTFNLNICSTNESFLEQIKKYTIEGNIYKENRKEPLVNMYRLVFTNKTSRLNFINYIYKDATIYLERKYLKACKYTNTVVIPNDKGTP